MSTKGRKKLNKIRFSTTIPKELNEQWSEVCKIYGITKSDMLADFLGRTLPIMLENDPNKIISRASAEFSKTFDEISKAFDNDDNK